MKTRYGLTLKTHNIVFFQGPLGIGMWGPLLHLEFPAAYMIDVIAGGAWRMKTKRAYFELGGGFGWNPIWGKDIAIIPAFGFQITQHFFISIPFIVRLARGIEYTPYFGIRFGELL